jgi:hypothetical protein
MHDNLKSLARINRLQKGPNIRNFCLITSPKDGETNTFLVLSLREASSSNLAPSNETIAVGDIVVVKNESTPRGFWKLAEVKELKRGDDSIIRSAKVKVVNSEKGKATFLRRAIQHLIPLELHVDNNITPDKIPDTQEQVQGSGEVAANAGHRSRRKAAVTGELLRRMAMNKT